MFLLNGSEDGIKNAKNFVLSENKRYQYKKKIVDCCLGWGSDKFIVIYANTREEK